MRSIRGENMARSKTFVREDVLDAAMQVFWRKGYRATSIQNLVEAMGINRGSLYDTFGDKARLFDQVMIRYISASPTQRLAELAETGLPREAIERLFADLVEVGATDRNRRGCLVTNTATELTGREEGVAERIGAVFDRLEDSLVRLIEQGQETGEISPWRESRALARLLVACVQGLRVISKVKPERAALQDVADLAIANLD